MTAPDHHPRPLSGWSDKLYWRRVGGYGWHCFRRGVVKDKEPRFVSLCGRFKRERSGGQHIDRPEPIQRCGLCDGREAARRGHDESMPARRDPASVERERQEDRAAAREMAGGRR